MSSKKENNKKSDNNGEAEQLCAKQIMLKYLDDVRCFVRQVWQFIRSFGSYENEKKGGNGGKHGEGHAHPLREWARGTPVACATTDPAGMVTMKGPANPDCVMAASGSPRGAGGEGGGGRWEEGWLGGEVCGAGWTLTPYGGT